MSHDKKIQKQAEAAFGHRPKSKLILSYYRSKLFFIINYPFSDCWGERHTFSFMAFIGLAVSYAIRFTLPIGIVAMVAKGKVDKPCLDQVFYSL